MTLFGIAVNSLYAEAAAKKVMVFGDSLVAGYGIPYDQAFPAQLEKKLHDDGIEVTVINAGVSGDTTSGGLTRLEWVLEQKPDYVILELGGNDMLRAVDPAVTKQNLTKMLDILKKRKIPVLLAGMKATPNLGPQYVLAYSSMYKKLAKEYDAVFYPFFMEGVAMDPQYTLPDGLHPTPAGIAKIVENILPSVRELLDSK